MKKINLSDHDSDSYCGTTYAAKLLGLSVGTVQNLVESNKLIAWKTQGGHRRISIKSIIDFKKTNAYSTSEILISENTPKILIVEDDEGTRNMYKEYFDQWNFDFEVVIYSSALEALLDFNLLSPLALITDLNMPNMNGFDFIKAIRKKENFSNLPVIAITGLTLKEISIQGGLDNETILIQKPVDMLWLKGIFQAIMLKS